MHRASIGRCYKGIACSAGGFAFRRALPEELAIMNCHKSDSIGGTNQSDIGACNLPQPGDVLCVLCCCLMLCCAVFSCVVVVLCCLVPCCLFFIRALLLLFPLSNGSLIS